MKSLLVFLVLILFVFDVYAQDSYDDNYDVGGYVEIRKFEAFNPSDGTYEIATANGVNGVIDHQTQKVYIQNQNGLFEVSISSGLLASAGVSASDLTNILTGSSSRYLAEYDLNKNFIRDDNGSGVPERVCDHYLCAPWQQSLFLSDDGFALASFERFGWDGSAPTSPTPQERETACRNVRDYSYRGMIDAVGVGLACASVTTVVGAGACAVAVVRLGHTTYQRQRNQRTCNAN